MCLAIHQLWARGLILHKALPLIPGGLLVEQWMQDWVWRECKLPGNYSHPWFWSFHFKVENATQKITPCLQQILLIAGHCVSMSGFSFFFFSLLLPDRIGEEVELQISFLLFCCLWSLPTESTLTKSRTLRLMLNWVNKLCMKLCRSL